MIQHSSKSRQKSPKSPKIITTKQIFKQLNRRNKNHQNNAITSARNFTHAVHNISDNLDTTRGKSSTQIKKHMFGKTSLGRNLTDDVVKKCFNIFNNPQITKPKKCQFEIYKPKPRNKQRDQKLLKRLYNQIKQQKQIQNHQKKMRIQQAKKKISRPITYKSLFSYNPQSMRFLQNQQFWAQFKQKTDKTIDFQIQQYDLPVTPKCNTKLQKQRSFQMKKPKSVDEYQQIAKSVMQHRNPDQQIIQQQNKNKKIFKQFNNFTTDKKSSKILSIHTNSQRVNSSRNTHRYPLNQSRNNLSENYSSKFKHPVSEIYQQAANTIFTERKKTPKQQITSYILTLNPFGNIENIQL